MLEPFEATIEQIASGWHRHNSTAWRACLLTTWRAAGETVYTIGSIATKGDTAAVVVS